MTVVLGIVWKGRRELFKEEQREDSTLKFCSFEEFCREFWCCERRCLPQVQLLMKHARRIQCTPVRNLRLARHLQTPRLPRATLGRLPGGSSTVTSRAPNVAYSRGMAAARARSASPGLRRSPSPLGVSVRATSCATGRTKRSNGDLRCRTRGGRNASRTRDGGSHHG